MARKRREEIQMTSGRLPRPVYLDMDPGHDDALALLAALRAVTVRGVTTVAGNQRGELTFLNARRVLRVAGRTEVAVRRGYDQPLLRRLVTAEQVHGASGLDGYHFQPEPEPSPDDGMGAMEWLDHRLAAEPDPVDWVATGPLTNVAAFLLGHPHRKRQLKQITFMGGSLGAGNVTPYAEFNTYVDPEATALVLSSGLPVAMVGLDVTLKALLAHGDIDRFLRLPGEVGAMLFGLFRFFGGHEPSANAGGMPVHDVLAVAAVAHPEFFRWQDVPLRVECRDPERRGAMTRVEGFPVTRVAVEVDVKAFFDWLWRTLEG